VHLTRGPAAEDADPAGWVQNIDIFIDARYWGRFVIFARRGKGIVDKRGFDGVIMYGKCADVASSPMVCVPSPPHIIARPSAVFIGVSGGSPGRRKSPDLTAH